jgi:hypothetical protein
VKRRAFILALGGAAAWPAAARAQQPGEQVRRIGVLTVFSKDDPEGQRRVAALLQRLQQLGWTDGRNVRIEFRWAGGDPDRARFYAGELVGMKPDVILVNRDERQVYCQRYGCSLRTLNALTGRWKPLRTSSPTASNSASASTSACTFASTRIWPLSA